MFFNYNFSTRPLLKIVYNKSRFKLFHNQDLNTEELIQRSNNIPGDLFNFQVSNKPQHDSSIMTLSKLKQEWLQDPTNLEITFKYMKKLNDNRLHTETIKVYNSLDYKNWQVLNEYQNALNYSSKGSQFSGLLRYILLGAIVYQFVYYIEQPKPNENIIDEPKQKLNVEDNNTARTDKLFNILKNQQQIQEEKDITTRFSDVLGIDEFKEELQEIVDFLKNPKKYTDSGAKLPKGILLAGPPGTGKTLLARALAGEAGCAFFYKSGSEFDEMFVGVGAARVREMFKTARQKAPSIIFIDEIDSIGGKRRTQDPSYSRDTINQILTEMDGFKQSESVIVIGATNFEKILDPALKRPGRFDKTIHIPLPDIKGRQSIFGYYLKKIKYDDKKIQEQNLARQTSGFSGADIQNMVNVAILNAIKNSRKEAINEDFEFALDRISMGIGRKKMHVSEKEKLMTAYHEGGHALISLLTEGAIPLHKVTILPRGGALGYTSMIPESDQLNYTRKGIIASIDVAMGGRAAEDLFLGHTQITTGCSNDLAKASDLAYMFVKQLGMDENISLISVQGQVKTSDQFDYMIDLEVKRILDQSYGRVKDLLQRHQKKLEQLAIELVKRETMSADEVKTLLQIN